jgi:hypothetical protein
VLGAVIRTVSAKPDGERAEQILTDLESAIVLDATDASTLLHWSERILTAQTLNEVLH